MGWFRPDREEEWLEQQRNEERERIREHKLEKELTEKKRLKKKNILVGMLVGICCIAALAITFRYLISESQSVDGTGQQQPAFKDGAVLSASWKELLNHGVIRAQEVQKIVFLDLAEDQDALKRDESDELFYTKDKDESVEGSGDVLAWVKIVDEQKVLYIGAEGGVWTPEDSSGLFSYCENLEEIEFNGAFHTENTVNMSAMFWGCSNLCSLDVSGFDTGNVTDMRYMFAYCQSLTELDLSGFDTGNLEAQGMDGIFSGCYHLKSVGNLEILEDSDLYGVNIFKILEKYTPAYEE